MQTVQVGHACLEAGSLFGTENKETPLIILAVKNEEELMFVSKLLEAHRLNYTLFYEPDYNYGNTALCTEATNNKSIFKRYKLLDQ